MYVSGITAEYQCPVPIFPFDSKIYSIVFREKYLITLIDSRINHRTWWMGRVTSTGVVFDRNFFPLTFFGIKFFHSFGGERISSSFERASFVVLFLWSTLNAILMPDEYSLHSTCGWYSLNAYTYAAIALKRLITDDLASRCTWEWTTLTEG